jgi:predicted Zn-dependent peptidase
VVRLEQKRTDQSHICLGLEGISLSDPDRYPCAIMNGILGDGMSSRLFLNLRERQGLAYDVASSLNHFLDCGSLVVYCGVEPRKVTEAVQAMVSELNGMRVEVGLPELTKAKEYAKGRLLLRMEDTRSVASWLGTQDLLLGSIATVDEVIEQIDRVEAADVARVAQRVLNEDKLRLAVVGPHRSDKSLRRLLRF